MFLCSISGLNRVALFPRGSVLLINAVEKYHMLLHGLHFTYVVSQAWSCDAVEPD